MIYLLFILFCLICVLYLEITWRRECRQSDWVREQRRRLGY